ncbi:hypothetical protein PAXINDRAFT_16192 [Paxillus involutus ATCC 200175]|uniref:Uncharacterized protein n=1 Tax=Paxillus involutus ATCC 200175 TaxID=664439 RepID=A0A0C9TJD4_PAXIN|nr:hypothetical protein PAXINDRAFT_16192 [Paxillus involutus ATCC 200175]
MKKPPSIWLEGETNMETSRYVEKDEDDHQPSRNPVGTTDGDERRPNEPTEPPDEEGERRGDGERRRVEDVMTDESSRFDEPEDEGVERDEPGDEGNEVESRGVEDEIGGKSEGEGRHGDGRTNGTGDSTSSASCDSKRVKTGVLAEDEGSQQRDDKPNVTTDLPGLPTPLLYATSRPTHVANPPRRRGRLKTRSTKVSRARAYGIRTTSYGRVDDHPVQPDATEMAQRCWGSVPAPPDPRTKGTEAPVKISSMMPGFEVVSQFTEDAYANEDRLFPASMSQLLTPASQVITYVAPVTRGPRDGHVIAAQSRSSVAAGPRDGPSLPDPRVIQQSVNAAQHKSSVHLPAVAVMPPPAPHSSMPPMNPLQARGPDVYVPSAWQNPPQSNCVPQSNNTPTILNQFQLPLGYGAQHAQYPSERDRWACLSYCPPPAETITLDITALYEGSPRKGCLPGTRFGNICKGKRGIDARITAHQLIVLALATLTPNIKAFCPKFLWRDAEFVVRDISWVDLLKHTEQHEPYFYKECF